MQAPPRDLVEALERDPRFAGKRARDIPQMAEFRRDSRERLYRLASWQFGLAIFAVVLAAGQEGIGHWIAVGGFCVSFVGMFYAEFMARRLTRQLNRSAADQLARDLSGIFD
jgi:hypothetical protein